MYFLRACNWQFSQYEDKVHLTLLDMLKLLYKYKQTNKQTSNQPILGSQVFSWTDWFYMERPPCEFTV